MVYIFFDKNFCVVKLSIVVVKMTICQTSNLEKNYTNQLKENLKKRKVHSPFIDNKRDVHLWVLTFSDMLLINKFNKWIHFLLSVIDIFRNYPWKIPLKDKKGIKITNAFQKMLDESNCGVSKSKGRKRNKIRVDKASEFFNRSMKLWLEKYYIKNIQTIMKENLLLLKDLLEA